MGPENAPIRWRMEQLGGYFADFAVMLHAFYQGLRREGFSDQVALSLVGRLQTDVTRIIFAPGPPLAPPQARPEGS